MKGKKVIISLILISCFILFGYCYKNVYLSNSIEAINMRNLNKKYVYPLGEIVGIKATTDGVLVIGYEDEDIEYIGGIEKGDNIVAINDIKIENVQDISEILENVNKDEVKISLTRDEKLIYENVKLKNDGENKRLGLWVRDKISGVGTITFYDPQESVFKGIGHAITDSDTNELLKIKQGYIYKPKNLNIEKGTNEKTGYLYGDFDLKNPIGEFKYNSNFGITGIYNSEKKKSTQLMEVGSEKDIKLGKACILLEDQNKNIVSYDININDISTDKQSTRQISIEVTDDRLLNYTGGIIQGMSGAPIIQNNKLIGAVTHVIKDNPKKGYGIFIDEMIKLENKD
nr:SpoIVB peptidase S55 domain-containing protein [uncultured Romboutsia sp.]